MKKKLAWLTVVVSGIFVSTFVHAESTATDPATDAALTTPATESSAASADRAPESPATEAATTAVAEATAPATTEAAAPAAETTVAAEPPASENLEFISGEITSLDEPSKSLTVKLYGETENAPGDKSVTVTITDATDITDGEKDRDLKSLSSGTEVDVEYDPSTGKATYIFVY